MAATCFVPRLSEPFQSMSSPSPVTKDINPTYPGLIRNLLQNSHTTNQSGAYGSSAIGKSAILSRSTTPSSKGTSTPLSARNGSIDQEHSSESSSHISDDDQSYNTPFTANLQADIDGLLERLEANVVVKDKAVTAPLFLTIPRGYLAESSLSPSRFLRSQKDVKEHVKKRKRDDTQGWRGFGSQDVPGLRLRQANDHDPHGFRPHEVNNRGAVHLEDCRPANLNIPIHPLFDRSCFDDVPDAIYDQLIPGLQLATMFLTQPICMQFWVTLAYGERQDDPKMIKRNGRLSQRIPDHVPLTIQNTSDIIERLREFGKSRLVHFRFRHRLAGSKTINGGGAWGLSDPICDYRGIQQEAHGQKSGLIRSIIRIHADYYIVAKRLSQLQYPEISQKLRFSFMFATLIVHELAHTIEGIHIRQRAEQWMDWHTSRFYKEPYWLDWTHIEHGSELGRAWEETLFGGEVAPINDRVDGSHGVGTTDWPPRGSKNDPERRVWYTVPMEYIESLFQMEMWEQEFDLKDWRVLNIPRDGAISLYLNFFTTMSSDEMQRLAEEEAADLQDLKNQEPAKKKRIVGEGVTEEHRSDDEAGAETSLTGLGKQPISKKRVDGSAQHRPSAATGTNPEKKKRRLNLIPQSRKKLLTSASKPSSSQRPKIIKVVAKAGSVSEDLTPSQQKFLHESRKKRIANPQPPSSGRGSRSRRPKGIGDRRRRRRAQRRAREREDKAAATTTTTAPLEMESDDDDPVTSS